MMTTCDRRAVASGLFIAAAALTAGAAGAAAPLRLAMTVYKDANCGCCTAWVERLRADGRFAAKVVNTPDLAGIKRRLGVPGDLAACHTGIVAGYLIEGHVPPADIARFVAARPRGLRGLAVPGMPAGSPGMETQDGSREPFEVIAFGARDTRRVFARHG